jgi:hypothetical protein
VIEQASDKVNNDPGIRKALEERKRAKLERRKFRDTRNAANIEKLPALLQPNVNGLTDGQFKVYEDV